MEKYQDINAKTIDGWIEEGWRWGQAISHEEYVDACNGKWELLLTPTVFVPKFWFGELKGKKVLGLASGGGQQMPILSAVGAHCTILDYSTKQIESERMISKREGYSIEIIQDDMTKPLPFEDESFDLIFHPVSNCYVEDVESIFKECYRILKRGGRLLCGLPLEMNYIVDLDEKTVINKMPFNPLVDEEYRKQLEADNAGIQFSHTLTEQIGGQLKAGFRLVDIYEDTNGEGYLHELNIKSFISTLSIKE